jgi:hypothetical protein
MRALPERAVAGFTEALLAERFTFLDAEQRSSTAQFVLDRWRTAAQPVQLGTGTVATILGGIAWGITAVRGCTRDRAWETVVRRCSARTLPLVSELTIFVLSLATAYASERWPGAPIAERQRVALPSA